jgi:hypothetical protein
MSKMSEPTTITINIDGPKVARVAKFAAFVVVAVVVGYLAVTMTQHDVNKGAKSVDAQVRRINDQVAAEEEAKALAATYGTTSSMSVPDCTGDGSSVVTDDFATGMPVTFSDSSGSTCQPTADQLRYMDNH